MGAVGVEVDPQRERLDRRLALGAGDDHRAAPLGHERPGPAAERPHLERVPEPREPHDAEPQAPQHPHAAAVEPGVDDVGERRVLQPPRDRVEPGAARRGDVGEAGRDGMPEHPAVGGRRDELGLRHYPVPRR